MILATGYTRFGIYRSLLAINFHQRWK